MAGQISQIDLDVQNPDTDPSRFVQLRFATNETPTGTISFYEPTNANTSVLTAGATIDVANATPTDTFTSGGFTYYTYTVDTDILAGKQQAFAIVYADAGGDAQSAVLFGTVGNPDKVEFTGGGPLDDKTVAELTSNPQTSIVEGNAFQSSTGPFAISPDGTVTTTNDPDPSAPCFTAGTLIATPAGPVAVEQIGVGDLVLTADGRSVPVLFAGHTTVAARFRRGALGSPILIRAGALGNNVPSQDLLVSPHHGMVIDNALIFAQALVNGTSILQAPPPAEVFRYYHLETEQHEVILANGAPAETFCDNISREAFDNYAEFVALYPQGREIGEMDLPHAKSRRQVPAAIIARLDARARELTDLSAKSAA